MITFSQLGRHGQLGNQLFQYALLRGVAARSGFEVRIPKRFVGVKRVDLVELEPFAIEAGALRESDPIAHRFEESGGAFDARVFEQPDGTDFFGYFQSERYFAHAAADVRREFTLRGDIRATSAASLQTVRVLADGAPLCSVHVRRGDYLQRTGTHRVLSADYYRAAIAHPALRPFAPVLLFFSDDLAWCRAQFPGQHYCRLPSHWHELAAMSSCDHHILAGSSFSWWGAWLNPNPTKVVIAPAPWYSPELGQDESDLLPASWIRFGG